MTAAIATRPRLRPGVELLGPMAGSALREPPCLVRRPDGTALQMSRLVFTVAAALDGSRDHAAIAEWVSERSGRTLLSEHVEFILESKLAPLDILADTDAPPAVPRPDPLLGLTFRIPTIPPRAVAAIGGAFRPLFHPSAIAAVLVGLVLADIWIVSSGGLLVGFREIVFTPILFLALMALMWVAVAFHEIGHAAACRYGGAMPGTIGAGLYLIWPVLYTDVTDSYRLGRGGRLRVDLGGIHFNAIFALAVAGAGAATGWAPLATAAFALQIAMLMQFVPWLRLDGHYVVADLVGVPDLFDRIRPTLRSLLPGRPADPRVRELKPWARVAIAAWVITSVPFFFAVFAFFAALMPRYLALAISSFGVQLDRLAQAAGDLALLDGLLTAVGTVFLALPWVAITLTVLAAFYGRGVALALPRRS